jgi:inner membrane protein
MPMPVAHSLVGASLVAALLPRRPRYWAWLAAGAVLANAADLDFFLVFVFGSRAWHRGFTHSLAFALAVCVCLLLALGRGRGREAAAFGLAFASHAVLDFATTEIEVSRGVELFWPFSSDRLGLRWWGLSELPSRMPAAEILKSLSLEFLLFAPPLLFLILLRRGAFRRSPAGGVE